MDQGHRGESHRPVLVRARSGARVQTARRRGQSLLRGRQDLVHQLRARGDPVGRPRQLRGVEGRRDVDDEESGTGSGALSHSRQQHLPGRHSHAHQHGGVGHAGCLPGTAEAHSVQAHRRSERDRARGGVAGFGLCRLCAWNQPLHRRRHAVVSRIRDGGMMPAVPRALEPGAALQGHWPEYLIEAWALGMFMISAGIFSTLLGFPGSPLQKLVTNEDLRRALVGVAMGLTAIGLIYSPWGKRSGAHMNPAVTLAFWRLGKVARWDAVFYILAQMIGGLLGVLIVAGLLRERFTAPPVSYVATLPGALGSIGAFAAEFVR